MLLAVGSLVSCTAPPAAYRLLFQAGDSGLSPAEMAAAFAAFSRGLVVSADGKHLEDPDCGELSPSAETVDLNGDGTREVFVFWGNACTSGMTGRNLTLLVRNADGSYATELGFPAASWDEAGLGHDGWPDLKFGGPGFCDAVWTRRDDTYEFKCNLPASPDGCADIGNVCQ